MRASLARSLACLLPHPIPPLSSSPCREKEKKKADPSSLPEWEIGQSAADKQQQALRPAGGGLVGGVLTPISLVGRWLGLARSQRNYSSSLAGARRLGAPAARLVGLDNKFPFHSFWSIRQFFSIRFVCLRQEYIKRSPLVPDMEHAMPTMTAESDDDVHLSPTSVSSGGGGGGGGGVGGIRFKILCSFGGRIMPRPSDGALKYIGGETRVLAVPRSIRFRDLKKKVEEMFKADVAAIKYQLLSSDDLDILVSVTCDEDLLHMLDEYDRFESKRSPSASPRFRVYVFVPQQASSVSSAAAVAIAVSSSRHAPTYVRTQQPQLYHHHQQHFQPERYVASVAGTPAGSPPYPDQPSGVASAGNSPRAEQAVFRGGMQRVRSSPNLGGLSAAPQTFSQHAGDGGGLSGYLSSSPGHVGAGHLFLQQGNSYSHYRNPQPQPHYSPAPVPVPTHHASGAGRHDMRGGGYALGGSSYMAAPMVPALRSGRPVSRSGGSAYGEMQTPKKAARIWD